MRNNHRQYIYFEIIELCKDICKVMNIDYKLIHIRVDKAENGKILKNDVIQINSYGPISSINYLKNIERLNDLLIKIKINQFITENDIMWLEWLHSKRASK